MNDTNEVRAFYVARNTVRALNPLDQELQRAIVLFVVDMLGIDLDYVDDDGVQIGDGDTPKTTTKPAGKGKKKVSKKPNSTKKASKSHRTARQEKAAKTDTEDGPMWLKRVEGEGKEGVGIDVMHALIGQPLHGKMTKEEVHELLPEHGLSSIYNALEYHVKMHRAERGGPGEYKAARHK